MIFFNNWEQSQIRQPVGSTCGICFLVSAPPPITDVEGVAGDIKREGPFFKRWPLRGGTKTIQMKINISVSMITLFLCPTFQLLFLSLSILLSLSPSISLFFSLSWSFINLFWLLPSQCLWGVCNCHWNCFFYAHFNNFWPHIYIHGWAICIFVRYYSFCIFIAWI